MKDQGISLRWLFYYTYSLNIFSWLCIDIVGTWRVKEGDTWQFKETRKPVSLLDVPKLIRNTFYIELEFGHVGYWGEGKTEARVDPAWFCSRWGGGGKWYQSTSKRNFKLKLFILVQTRRNVKIVLQLPQNVARARTRAIWLVFYLKLHEKNHVITYTKSTVLGIIGKKGGKGEEDCFSFVTNNMYYPQMMFL